MTKRNREWCRWSTERAMFFSALNWIGVSVLVFGLVLYGTVKWGVRGDWAFVGFMDAFCASFLLVPWELDRLEGGGIFNKRALMRQIVAHYKSG